MLACLLCVGIAVGSPSPQDRRAAAKLELQAEGLSRRGEREQAIEKFREADELEPLIWRKYRMGKLLSDLAKLTEAAEILERATEEKAFAPRERMAMGKVTKLLASVRERIPTLTVRVVEPVGSSVTVEIDGKSVDPDAGPLPLDPGYHQVVAKASGYEEMSREVTLAEKATESVEIKLVATAGVAAPGEGTEDEDDDDSPGGGIGKWPAGLAWGLGAVGAGLGIGFGVAALNETDELRTTYSCVEDRCPPAAQDDLDTSKLHGNISTAGFVIGGAGLVLGIILWVVDDASDDSSVEPEGEESTEAPAEESEQLAGVRIQPLVGLGVVGVNGTF